MTFFGPVKERIASYLAFFKDIGQTAYLLQKGYEVCEFARHRLISLLRQLEQTYPTKQSRRVIRSVKRHLIAPVIDQYWRRFRIYKDAKNPHYSGCVFIKTRVFKTEELENIILNTLKRYYSHPKDREVVLQRLLERVRLSR